MEKVGAVKHGPGYIGAREVTKRQAALGKVHVSEITAREIRPSPVRPAKAGKRVDLQRSDQLHGPEPARVVGREVANRFGKLLDRANFNHHDLATVMGPAESW